jgi:hypothetical protein
MKESGEFPIGSIRGVKAGAAKRCRAREEVTIMQSERMWSMVRE